MSNQAIIAQNDIARAIYLVDAASGMPLYNSDGVVLLASSAITANGNSELQLNSFARGVKLYVNPGTFGSGASAITVKVQGFDPVSRAYYDLLTSASLTASTFAVLTVYPGITVSSNVSVSDVLPRSWRVAWQASAWGTGGSTLGIAAALLL
jgi:hypothetical protein